MSPSCTFFDSSSSFSFVNSNWASVLGTLSISHARCTPNSRRFPTTPITTCHSQLIIYNSSFARGYSQLIIHYLSFATHHFATHYLQLIIHNKLMICKSSFTTHYLSYLQVIICKSSFTTHHLQPSFATHHLQLVIHNSLFRTTLHSQHIICNSLFTNYHSQLIIRIDSSFT